MSLNSTGKKLISGTSILVLLIAMSSCAAFQPIDSNGPRSKMPPYPIVASAASISEGATVAWSQLAQRYGLPQQVTLDLHPLTGTIHSMPANPGSSIFLPKVGSEQTQTEEETRESLRR